MLVVASSPAQAAPPDVAITEISTNMQSGDKTTFKYTVKNGNGASTSFRIQVSGMDCGPSCSGLITIEGGATREFVKTLTAPAVDPGDDESVEVAVEATVADNPRETDDANQTVQVRGPEKSQTVRQISGKVRDADGKAIAGAQVILQDTANHRYETTSNNSGAYSFTATDDKPITPGKVSIGAGKEGFKPAAITVDAEAGKTVSAQSIKLTSTTVVPSPTPSTTEGASAAPLEDPTDGATDTGETAAALDPASNEDEGSGSMLFFILGGLFVAAGVGAIVLVLMRRKGNGDDDASDVAGGPIPPGPAGRGYGDATRVAAPVGARAADATMVGGMAVPPSIADAPTMLQRPVPADDEFPDPYGAPAQMAHGGYTAAAYGAGAPVPVQGGYDDEYAGPATQYGRPVQAHEEEYGGFVPPAGDQRYDEQTGMYRPEPAYEPPTGYDAGGYQGGGYGAGGYGQQSPQPEPSDGYGSWNAPAGGADNGNAYGPASGADAYGSRAQASGGGAYGGRTPAPDSGAYGAGTPAPDAYGTPGGSGTYGAAPAGGGTYGAGAGGYEAPPQRGGTYGGAPAYGDQGGAGYGADQGGYDPRATYGRPEGYEPPPSPGGQPGGYGNPAGYDQTGYQPGGYDQGGYDQGGYEQQQGGGRHGGPARPEPTPPGQRRPVDWLDD